MPRISSSHRARRSTPWRGRGSRKDAVQHDYDENLATNRYFDGKFGLEAAKILPGEYFVANREALPRHRAGLLVGPVYLG